MHWAVYDVRCISPWRCTCLIDPSFIRLSAYLFEATQNQDYLDAAKLSLDFMFNHMWINETIIYDYLLNTCAADLVPFTLNQAGFIEGESVALLDRVLQP